MGWGQCLGQIGIWVWVGLTFVPITYLMAGHLLALPVPREGSGIEALAAVTAASPSPNWRAFHVLAEKCGCSSRVIEKLVERGPRPGFEEKILLIGEGSPSREAAVARGFSLETLTARKLQERYGIQGAPLLVVVDPRGRIAYSGGYTRRKQGEVEDVAILADLVRGVSPAERPLFGCAVSSALQQQLDPLRLKYSRRE